MDQKSKKLLFILIVSMDISKCRSRRADSEYVYYRYTLVKSNDVKINKTLIHSLIHIYSVIKCNKRNQVFEKHLIFPYYAFNKINTK